MMRGAVAGFFAFLLAMPAGPAFAAPVAVHNLRQWAAPDHTRLVLDLSGPVEHRLSSEQDPPRIQIDLDQAVLREALPALDTTGPRLAALRIERRGDDSLRVVIDLKREVRPRSFVLKPAGPYGHRLVIDLHDPGTEEEGPKKVIEAAGAERGQHEFLIAIDAGHGGEDPGAIGRRYRTREKDVTLAIAQELARLVAATPGMRPLLTRRGDYYVGLEKRYRLASNAKADIFVSIHADAVPHGSARGSSVYVLSDRGATNALAKALADRENAADMVGGESLGRGDDQVLKVVLDMMQSKTMEYSLQLGGDILAQLRQVGPVHARRVNQAGFMVLKAPNVPSVLVETAFISNPTEEKNLRTPAFQREIAQGILNGIRRYLAGQKPAPAERPVTTQAPASAREHVVRRGETLASIARQYRIHVDALRFFNDLGDDELLVGSRLRIPPPDRDG